MINLTTITCIMPMSGSCTPIYLCTCLYVTDGGNDG